MNNNILVCTVGGSTDPIIDAIDQNSPQFVYFICSSGQGNAASSKLIREDTTRQQCPSCKTKVTIPSVVSKAKLDESRFLIVETPQPDDLDSVVKACEEVRNDIAQRFGSHPAIVLANYTGGTKTMSLGLGVFATRPNVQWILQVQSTGRRIDTVKIGAGGMSQRQDTSILAIADAKQLAEMLANNRQDFDGASAVIKEITRVYPLSAADKRDLAFLRSYYELRAALDRFDFAGAIELIKAVNLAGAEIPALTEKEWLDKAKDLLRGSRALAGDFPCSKEEKGTLLLLDDLIENAVLCAKRQRYDDAVSRLYRATELTAQIRLKQHYEIDTSNIKLDNAAISEESRIRLQATAQAKGKKKIELGLQESFLLLHEIGDPVGSYWNQNKSQLLNYLTQRNQSYLAHGFKSITKEIWLQFGDGWIDWLHGARTRFAEKRVTVGND